MAAPSFAISVTVNQKDIDRLDKRLDKWQGKPLAIRMDKALAAGARIFALGLKTRAPKGETGGLRRSVRVSKLRRRGRQEVAAYRIMPTKRVPDGSGTALLTALLVYGTPRNWPDPFVDETQRALEPAVTAFISEQVTRLA